MESNLKMLLNTRNCNIFTYSWKLGKYISCSLLSRGCPRQYSGFVESGLMVYNHDIAHRPTNISERSHCMSVQCLLTWGGVNKRHPPIITLPWLWTERGEEVSSNIPAFLSSWWPRVSCSVLAQAERPSYSVPLCVLSHRGTLALSCSKQSVWRNRTVWDRQRIKETFQVRVTDMLRNENVKVKKVIGF